MTRLTFREKKYLDEINIGARVLRLDWSRRLRNALFALANMDRSWMIWVEQHVPSQCEPRTAAQLVEVRARTLLMQDYKHLGPGAARAIIEGDRPFTDDGSLSL